jgi:hypothetical protein
VKSRRVSPRVRAFVDWLVDVFEDTGQVDRDLSHVHRLMHGLQAA